MKTYTVYDSHGFERGYIRAANQNAANNKVVDRFGEFASVSYTELGPEFDHCKGFFTDFDAKVMN